MILDDVPEGAGGFVERAAPLDAEVLGGRDLHGLDVVAIPHGLEEGVREPEVQEVHDLLLPQIAVDAEHRLLGEGPGNHRVERLRGREVATEGLLHYHSCAARELDGLEPLDHGLEHRRRDRQIVGGVLGFAERLLELGEGGIVRIVAVHVLQQAKEAIKHGLVSVGPRGLHRLGSPLLEVRQGPLRERDTDDGYVELVVRHHPVQRGEDLLLCKVAARTEEHQCV